MILISHRGNINGCKNEENSPESIDQAIKLGYDVEIDLWFLNNEYWLGHHMPKYKVHIDFIQQRQNNLWCHAKNFEALKNMLENNIHCFWHQSDKFTLTSHGFIWTYPNQNITNQSVIVCESAEETKRHIESGIPYAICSDFVGINT
tara:strand:- start:269 stop:709 length:441 start_codon:yes stop_codon:yes gene_type:complete